MKPPSDESSSPVLKPADNDEEDASKSNLTEADKLRELHLSAAEQMFGDRSPTNFENSERTPERPIDGT